MQPVSRDWIGLDTRVCRGETPIRQVNEKHITKTKKPQISCLTSFFRIFASDTDHVFETPKIFNERRPLIFAVTCRMIITSRP